MPLVSYAYFDGIEGSCTQAGREGSVEIRELEHIVEVPVDNNNATATGTRQHGGLKLTANIDKATPLLMKSVCNSSPIATVKIEFWEIDGEGKQVNYYNIEMENVRIVAGKTWYPCTDDEKKTNYKHMMTYTLRYDAINWIYTDGNLSHRDQWAEPTT